MFARKARAGGRRYNSRKVFRSAKKRTGHPSTAVIRQPSACPDRLFVKLVFSERLTWTQTTGNVSANVYKLNSLYDPDLTGTGLQPYFFDQWASLYYNYRVKASKIEFTVMCGGNSHNNAIAFILPSDESTAFGTTSQDLILEQPRCKFRSLKMGYPGVGQTKLTHYMDMERVSGFSKVQTAGTDFGALVSADPAQLGFWHIGTWCPDGNTPNLNTITKITFYAEFYNRKRPAVS